MAEVIPSASFLRDLKPLAKKFPLLLTEVAQMGKLLAEQPQTGTSLGNNCFKIRLAVRSKGTGKRGGSGLSSESLRSVRTKKFTC